MPGFKLARACAEAFPKQAHADTLGMLLLNHGLFTYGATAKASYERMIELVTRAEMYLAEHGASSEGSFETGVVAISSDAAAGKRVEIASLRSDVSKAAGTPLILSVRSDAEALNFVKRPDLGALTQQGPATPDHVIRTKRVPLIGRDVNAYVAEYRDYFAKYGDASLTMLDPAPRVVLDVELGLCCIGRNAKDAKIVEDIYRHTMDIQVRACALGGWRALCPRDIFEVEYWDLEQAKLRKSGAPPQFAGEIALVTGAASGIGKACVSSLLSRGAAVVGLDVSSSVLTLHQRQDYLGIQCDLTNDAAIIPALEQTARAYGGLDMLILNAGIFPPTVSVAELSSDLWRRTMSINLDANLTLLRECHPLLKRSPRGGRVVFIGSKNVVAPGRGAAAYSASKAALQQLARVAALEWGEDRIRINTLHPNAVFDTNIWSPEVLAARAASYRMTVQEYKTNNVLKVEIGSKQVAELATELCGPAFAATTGAQIPVDGGNERVI
jgi:NAD(P)-dependent dehydrogenase (short-subunit alcohol dehydrogenase family)